MPSHLLRKLLLQSVPRCLLNLANQAGRSSMYPNSYAVALQQSRSYSFFQLDKVFSFKRLQEERLRLQDEMDRGYFEDFKDLKKNQGKLGPASKNILPIVGSASFPELVCRLGSGSQKNIQDVFRKKDVTLACVAFRQNAQPMIDTWTRAFSRHFQHQPATQLVELSVVESIFLRPFQTYLVKSMSSIRRQHLDASPDQSTVGLPPEPAARAETSAANEKAQSSSGANQEHKLLYHFAETWAMRKALNMPNRLTAYALLVDREGRVRWRATGSATEDEIRLLQRATERLLAESRQATNRSRTGSLEQEAGQVSEEQAAKLGLQQS